MRFVFVFVFAWLVSLSGVLGGKAKPNVDKLLRRVRMVAVAQDGRLDGQLRFGRDRAPVVMFMKQNHIQYQIDVDGRRLIYQLTLGANDQKLQLRQDNAWKPLPKAKYAQRIGPFGLTYEDLSLRFLYWPNGKIVGEDNIQSVDCWRVLLRNPDGHGSYASVLLWIGKKNLALMRIEGFNAENEALKRFMVGNVMKLDQGFFVKTMEVYPFREGGRRLARPTYIQFEKPDKLPQRP